MKPELHVIEGGSMDKQKALEAALAQIDKNFGKGSIMRLGANDRSHDVEAISTGSLDPIATAKIEELIDELRSNFCIIIVTHSMQQAARVSQRTAFFHLGTLVEEGDTKQIFTNPVDQRTQDYITGRFG